MGRQRPLECRKAGLRDIGVIGGRLRRVRIVKPRIFVGSSFEALSVAYAIQENLEYDAECTVWAQGAFTPSAYTLDALVEELEKSDFGAFVFSPDDRVISRGEEKNAVRDNVLFELGLYVGRLGRKRTFIIQPRGNELRVTTDLAGVTVVTFDPDRGDQNLRAALGPACNQIRESIKRLGPVAQTVEQVVAELDEKALTVMSVFARVPYFSRPPADQFDATVFDQGVSRLRLLKCLRFDVSEDGKQYAYHWTDLGKIAIQRFGYEKGPGIKVLHSGSGPTGPGADLSPEAVELLLNAAEDTHGIILVMRTMRGQHIQTNERQFGELANPRSEAKWRAAVDSLRGCGAIEGRGSKGEVFGLTDRGYRLADEVRKRKRPLRVSHDKTAGPYIMVHVRQLDELTSLLKSHGVPHSVEESAVSLNGAPEMTVVNLGREGNAEAVQAILDGAG
jgi:hypothetical protein